MRLFDERMTNIYNEQIQWQSLAYFTRRTNKRKNNNINNENVFYGVGKWNAEAQCPCVCALISAQVYLFDEKIEKRISFSPHMTSWYSNDDENEAQHDTKHNPLSWLLVHVWEREATTSMRFALLPLFFIVFLLIFSFVFFCCCCCW